MTTAQVVRAHKRPDREPCSITGCGQSLYCRALCIMHYSRLRKTGDVGLPDRQRVPIGEGSVDMYGYRVIKLPGHPLANAQNKALEHRVVLFDAIGIGPHPCHWCGRLLPWRASKNADRINVDHLDAERLNNVVSNLVVSCLDCNTKRGGKR